MRPPSPPPPSGRLRVPLGAVLGLLLAATATAQNSDLTSQGAAPDMATRPVPRDRLPVGRTEINGQILVPASATPDLLPIYFPAPIPVLGSELPPAPAVRDALWTEFTPHTNELFFAPLSTRLAGGNLHRRLRQRLDAYQSTRAALLTDLRRQLETGEPAAPAGDQETKLMELAAQADALRRELYQGGFLSGNADWNRHRNWRLGSDTRRSAQELLYDEMTILRAAVYYQEGLVPAQRELLREIVAELAETIGGSEATALDDSFEPTQVIYFLPHGARLRLPSGLPAGLAADVASFTAEKNALKLELRSALYALDRESDGRRERALQELAVKQEPRFAVLEPLAERIRTGLAALPEQTQAPSRPGLPTALAARIDAYLRAKAELQQAARKAEEVARPAPAGKNDRKSARRDSTAGSAALAEFEEQNRQRFAALATEARAIREEVARAAASQPGDNAGKSVDALLADFMSAFKQQQLQSLYQDYRTAVLRPGLTPAQRQLLFNAALAGLDLTGIKDWQAVPE